MVHKIKKREQKIFTADLLRQHWGDGKPITFNGKKYRVGRMSYGDYFFEPIMSLKEKKKYYGETKPFHPKTLWLGKKLIENRYGVKQVVFEVI